MRMYNPPEQQLFCKTFTKGDAVIIKIGKNCGIAAKMHKKTRSIPYIYGNVLILHFLMLFLHFKDFCGKM